MNHHSRITWLIGGVLSLIALSVGLKYAVGLIAGLAFGEIHRRVKANYIGNMLFFREHKPFGSYLFFTLGMMFLCVPILLGAIYPDRINVFTAAFGILLFKYEMYFREVFLRRKEE